jgi:hypothetical protein
VYLRPDEFRARARDFKQSAFRLEARQTYNVESEQADLAEFLAGKPKPDKRHEAWYSRIRESIAGGKIFTKVKILREPLTDYQRYSLAWAMPDSVAAGMEYRIIDITNREVDLPDLDFWLYDDATVVVLDFYEDDSPRGAELIETGIDQYRRWRDIALKESIPLSEYRA